jgi:endonuclease-3
MRPQESMSRVASLLIGRHGDGPRLSAERPDPYRTLVACLISLRTKDQVTDAAASRLFARARTPRGLLKLSPRAIEKLIYPACFYRVKARTLHAVSRELLERFDGRVPDTIDALLTLPGVGRKTANLVVSQAYGKPGICVDTHVHRISNRLGWVTTRDPHGTEEALRRVLPRRLWIPINEILVRHGQQICKPISPVCSACPVDDDCPKAGVTRRR